MVDWARFRADGISAVGKHYIYGAKAEPSNDDPVAYDCAELAFWLYGRRNVRLPDYSDGMMRACLKSPAPKFGDLGFWAKKGKPAHHTGILWDNGMVLEARGAPFNKVILRPRSKWEAWPEFLGWYRPIALTQKERT